jgi:microcystin degradation protein MlrC
MLWNMREQLIFTLPEAAEAVRMAIIEAQTATKPVVLVEMGDNIGGGSARDSTIILNELLQQRAPRWVVILADPAAVQECIEAGIEAEITLRIG